MTLLLLSRYGLLRPLIANLTHKLRCTPFGHGFTPTPNRELDTAAQCITPMTALGAIAGYGNDSHRQQLLCSCMFTERACRPPFQGASVVRCRVFSLIVALQDREAYDNSILTQHNNVSTKSNFHQSPRDTWLRADPARRARAAPRRF